MQFELIRAVVMGWFKGIADEITYLTLSGLFTLTRASCAIADEPAWKSFTLSAHQPSLKAGDTPWERLIQHKPGERVTLRYRIIQDWDGVPHATGGNSYRPVIQPGYVQLIGETLMVYPTGMDADSAVSFDIETPKTWVIASDLQEE